METEISRWLFIVYDYHKMVDAGILCEDDRVELIRGEILEMSLIGPRHSAAVQRDEPQPDIYLLRPKKDFYASGHASASDIFLIVEMADSSLEYDQGVKMHLYAETGVPEYWVADIRNDRLIVYSAPRKKTYSGVHHVSRGNMLTPRLLPDCRIPVDAPLP